RSSSVSRALKTLPKAPTPTRSSKKNLPSCRCWGVGVQAAVLLRSRRNDEPHVGQETSSVSCAGDTSMVLSQFGQETLMSLSHGAYRGGGKGMPATTTIVPLDCAKCNSVAVVSNAGQLGAFFKVICAAADNA